MDLAVDQAGHVVEGVILFLEIDEGRGGKAPCSELFGRKNDEGGEAFSIFVGIGIQESAINDAEDGSRGADAEGECKDGDGGEAGVLVELSDTVAALRNHGIKPIANPCFT